MVCDGRCWNVGTSEGRTAGICATRMVGIVEDATGYSVHRHGDSAAGARFGQPRRESSVLSRQLSSDRLWTHQRDQCVAPAHPTCATSAESPFTCCQRKNTTEITPKKNNPPGIHMISAPIS